MKYYMFSAEKPLHFVNIGNFTGGHDYIHETRIISDYEIFAVQSGKLFIEQGGERYTTAPRQMLFNLPHILQKGYAEHYVQFYWLHFTCHTPPVVFEESELIRELQANEAYFNDKIVLPQQTECANWDKAMVLLGQLFNSARSRRRQTANDYMATTILLDISNQTLDAIRRDTGKADTKLTAILTFIEDNKHRPLTVKDIAEQFEYNEKYFSQVFKNKTGVSPKKYITDRKIDFAKGILVSTVHTIGDVARFVGYEDEHLFMRIFKQETGMTPSRYRSLFSEQR